MPSDPEIPPAAARDMDEPPVLDDENASRSLRRGLISLAILVALVVGLLLAVPGLHGVGRTIAHLRGGWVGPRSRSRSSPALGS